MKRFLFALLIVTTQLISIHAYDLIIKNEGPEQVKVGGFESVTFFPWHTFVESQQQTNLGDINKIDEIRFYGPFKVDGGDRLLHPRHEADARWLLPYSPRHKEDTLLEQAKRMAAVEKRNVTIVLNYIINNDMTFEVVTERLVAN